MLDPKKDNLERRCPRLGSMISFKYCMLSGEEGDPCFKVLDCWWETFDVDAYLKANIPESLYNELVSRRPKPKVASLVEIAEQARKRVQK